jgi:UDP-glucose 4-epimerase
VLVTGGAGFIGSHLVAELVLLGAKVTVVDDLSTGAMHNLQQCVSSIEVLTCDLRDMLALDKRALWRFDTIFHLAGSSYVPPSVENPTLDFALNAEMTLGLLDNLRHVEKPPRLVYVSSAAVYGSPQQLPILEDGPTIPVSPYGVSKLAAERYVSVFSSLYGIPAAAVRLFSVYGPRQRKQVVYDLIGKVRHNPEIVNVIGDGTQTRDFVHVNDVVQALLLVDRRAPCQGEVYNVASGHSVSINGLLCVITDACKARPRFYYSGSVRKGDADKWKASIERISALGYMTLIPLDFGIKTTVRWFDGEQRAKRAAAR